MRKSRLLTTVQVFPTRQTVQLRNGVPWRDSGKVQEIEESALAMRKVCPANDIEVRERERAGCCSAGTSSPGVAIKPAPPVPGSRSPGLNLGRFYARLCQQRNANCGREKRCGN